MIRYSSPLLLLLLPLLSASLIKSYDNANALTMVPGTGLGPDSWVRANFGTGLQQCPSTTPPPCTTGCRISFTLNQGPTLLLTGSPLPWTLYLGGSYVTYTSVQIEGVPLSMSTLVYTDRSYSSLVFQAAQAVRNITISYTIDWSALSPDLCSIILLPVVYPTYFLAREKPTTRWTFLGVCLLLLAGIAIAGGFLYITQPARSW